ncbi:cytochrome P450 [Microbacterium trichothecenolyticum]
MLQGQPEALTHGPRSGVVSALLRDDAPALLTRGYDFGARIWRRTRPGARAAPMRFLFRDAMLVRGAEGVDLFYDADVIARHGAMPAIVQETLFGHGSVHSLDGPAHLRRKAAFVDIAYEDAQVERLRPLLQEEWSTELAAWVGGGARSAYDAAVGAFGRSAMRWAGLPGTPAAQTRWAARLAQIVDGFGTPYSPGYGRALINRWWSDAHAKRLIEAAREGRLAAAPGTALDIWAQHLDVNGLALDARLAGVELQNAIRPMIAVARFVAFAAKELHDRPEWRTRIAMESADRETLSPGPLAVAFAQEVRRTAPFVPLLPAWATSDVELDGVRLPSGGRVVLDILGTDTDESSWDHPHRFDPGRFAGIDDYETLRAFIPHGGADVRTGHRCPGEKLAIAGLATAITALSDPRLRISGAGLDINRRRLPTKPRSGGLVRASATRGRCPFH